MKVCILVAVLATMALATTGCYGRARAVETVVTIHSTAGTVNSEQLGSRACLWISGLTNYHTVVTLLLAHDQATLTECAAMSGALRKER